MVEPNSHSRVFPVYNSVLLTESIKFGAGEGNRTLVVSLEGCCSTIELHPRKYDPPVEIGGEGWIRTNVGIASGFTVRPL